MLYILNLYSAVFQLYKAGKKTQPPVLIPHLYK